MNYVTNYYKNLSEQLQEKVNVLQYKLQYLNERIDRSVPPPPELLRNPSDSYYTNDELRQLGKPKPSGTGSWWLDYLLGAFPAIFALTQNGLVMRGAGLTTLQISETVLANVIEGLAPCPVAWIPYLTAAGFTIVVGVGGYYYVKDMGNLTVHVLQNLPGAQRIDQVDPSLLHQIGGSGSLEGGGMSRPPVYWPDLPSNHNL